MKRPKCIPWQCLGFIFNAAWSFTIIAFRPRSRSRIRFWSRAWFGSRFGRRITYTTITISGTTSVMRFRSWSWFRSWHAARRGTSWSFLTLTGNRSRSGSCQRTRSRSARTPTPRSRFATRSWSSGTASCSGSLDFPMFRSRSSGSTKDYGIYRQISFFFFM